MTLWMIRGGSDDRFCPVAREYGVAILGFNPVPDLSKVSDKRDLRKLVQNSYPKRTARVITNWTDEFSAFLWELETGDDVFMPYDSGKHFVIGVVQDGPYRYRTDLHADGHHTRPVHWMGDIVRNELPDGLWEQLKGRLTVKRLEGTLAANLKLTEQAAGKPTDTIDEVSEGERRQTERTILSRNPAIIRHVWETNVRAYGGSGQCESCGFRHVLRTMFDVHHLRPIAVGGTRKTRTTDLAVLCPTCHRLAHTKPGWTPFTIAELRTMVG